MREGDAFLLGVVVGVLGVLVVAPYTTLLVLRHSSTVRSAVRWRLENAIDRKIAKSVADLRSDRARPLMRSAVNTAIPIIEVSSGQRFSAFVHNEVTTQGVAAAFAAFDIPNP